MNMRSMVSAPGSDRRPNQVDSPQSTIRHSCWLRSVLVSFICLSLLPCASAQVINRIYFFGDSLSDSGNHFIFTHESTKQPFPVGPPDDSYDIGGHHYSDGATWAEQLATTLHTPTSGNPSMRVPGRFTNYAIGRARARAGAPVFPLFDLNSQIQQYLADFGGQPAQPTDLFVIWIGANDLDDALNALSGDPSGVASAGIIQAAIAAIIGDPKAGIPGIQGLYAAGARMFLVANVPDLAKTPYVQFLGGSDPKIPPIASWLTGFFNGALHQAVGALAAELPPQPNQFIREFDVNALFAEILAKPGDFGFTNVTDRCTTPGVTGNAICSARQNYLFWDGIHPTTAGHAALAQRAVQILPPQ